MKKIVIAVTLALALLGGAGVMDADAGKGWARHCIWCRTP